MLRFEGYTLDAARNLLRAGNRDVPLRPKAFEVLRYLVENADRLVTKDELIQAIWPNVIVTDDVLTHCVSEVRQAIGDGDQTIIKTVPRRGYRFAAEVSRLSMNAGGPQSLKAGIGAAPATSDAGQRWGMPLLDRPSIAVLPFTNLGGDHQPEYFNDGITEDIITELSRFSELLVIAHNSTFQYKGKAVNVPQVGRELGVRYVLEGTVRRSGDRVRITAQLIDAVTGAHRWAERYDRQLCDVFVVQDEVARAIVAILAVQMNRAEVERTLLKPPATWEAYDYYLRGAEAYFLHMRRRTTAPLYDARRLLEHSLAIDPDYARAYAMLSWTHVHAYYEPVDGDHMSPAVLDRALDLAEMAVHLDARLPQAHAQLGWVLLWKRQHDAAIAEFEHAIKLNPNFIDNRFGHVLTYAGEPTKAVEVMQANNRLDPFQPPISLGFLGHAYYMLKRHDDAARLLRECISRVPKQQMPHLHLAASYAQLKQSAAAKAEATEVLRINPGFTIGKRKDFIVYKNSTDAKHHIDGLRKAGLPEG